MPLRITATAVTGAAYSPSGQVPGLDVSKNAIWAANYGALGSIDTPPVTHVVSQDGPIATNADTLIDASNAEITVTLGRPSNYKGQKVHVGLVSRRSDLAYVSCVESGGGTLMLTPAAPSRQLAYVKGAWQAIQSGLSETSPDSFFPTTQHGLGVPN